MSKKARVLNNKDDNNYDADADYEDEDEDRKESKKVPLAPAEQWIK
jgi:hypothetical protein